MMISMSLHQGADGLRYVDITAGILLLLGLVHRWIVRGRNTTMSERLSLRTALVSWGLLALANVGQDIDRLGQAFHQLLLVRLVGDSIGVVYCVVAASMEWEKRHQRDRNI